MKKVWICLLILLATALPSAAQNDTHCSLLDKADCDLLNAAGAAFQQAESFQVTHFEMTLGGFGGTSTGNDLMLTGSGSVLLDGKNGVGAFDLTFEGNFNTDEPSNGEAILLDNQLYVANENEAGEMVWQVAELAEGGSTQAVVSGELFLLPFTEAGISEITRLEDEESLAVFQADVELTDYLLTEPVLQLIEAILANTPDDQFGGAAGAVGEDVAGAIQLLGAFMQQDVLTVKLYVNPDDHLLYRFEMVVDILLNAGNMGEVGLNAHLMADLDQHGKAVKIVLPDDIEAETIDPANFLSSILGTTMSAATPAEIDLTAENSMTYGETVTGTLEGANSQDVWAFEASAGDVITITMQATDITTGLDTLVSLFNADDEEIIANDDHNADDDRLDVFDSQISAFEIPADGEYRIVATWQAPTRDSADYELTLELVE